MIAALIALAAGAAGPPPLVLEPNGLGLPGGRQVRFGVPMTQAVRALAGVLGAPLKRGTYPDCGQGIAIGHVHFRGDLEITSIKGRFVGWTVDPPGGTPWRTAKGVGLGSTLAELKRAYPDTDTIDNGDDGVTFVSEHGPSGFLSGRGPKAKAVSINAGQTCIVD